MDLVILGGSGFVGLNVAEAALAAGHAVTLFDRAPPPPAALAAFAAMPGRLAVVTGNVTDAGAVADVLASGADGLVLGAAVTADAEREARDPETILGVNLLSHVAALRAARAGKIGRIVNLSSAAAYGEAGLRAPILAEDGPTDPVGLYGLTKWATERLDRRLAQHWGLDLVSLRLSAVFGPWERDTGVRDTLSAPYQIAAFADAGRTAVLSRPGMRDWTYAPDVAAAVLAALQAERLAHPVYNVAASPGFPALDWGRAYVARAPGGACRLAEPGEAPNVDLHGPTDRAPLATDRIRSDLRWQPRFDLAGSAEHYAGWRREHAGGPEA